MGFQNEKDHPEVAPSQFEINYGYGEVVAAADQIQLYKLLAARSRRIWGIGLFLPKPVAGVNGNGMHTNLSVSKGKANLIWDPKGVESDLGLRLGVRGSRVDPCARPLPGDELERERLSPLDPHFEAPNQIKASATDRGAMVRIPIGEVDRSVWNCARSLLTPTLT